MGDAVITCLQNLVLLWVGCLRHLSRLDDRPCVYRLTGSRLKQEFERHGAPERAAASDTTGPCSTVS